MAISRPVPHHGGVGTSYSYAIGPIMAFVSVYPLTMILRLFTAQALVLFFG